MLCTIVLMLLHQLAAAQVNNKNNSTKEGNQKTTKDGNLLVAYDQYHLLGTCIIPNTRKGSTLTKYDLDLSGIEKTNCKESIGSRRWKPDTVITMVNTDDKLIAEITITDNCCYEFLCDAYVDSNAVLHLLYTGYGEVCFCNCCYGLTYIFRKSNSTVHPTITGIIINEDPRTFKVIW